MQTKDRHARMIKYYFTIINAPEVWLSIIAINMTVIGLTSLAEKKSIIGVDYTRFLFTKYKLFWKIRILYLLVAFAIINAMSLFIMTVSSHYFILKAIVFSMLLLSLVFIIYYFFSFILIENQSLTRQVIESEILGLYFDVLSPIESSNPWLDLINFGPIAEKNPTKHLGTNVISYFDKYNVETSQAFKCCFGPQSILYPKTDKEEESLNAYYLKHFNRTPPNYTRKNQYGSGAEIKRTYYISREFLDFLQYSRIPFIWLTEMAGLMFDFNHAEGVWKRFDLQLAFSNMSMIMRFMANDGYLFDEHFLSIDFADTFFRYVAESWSINEKALYNEKAFDSNDICPQQGLKESTFSFFMASFIYKILSSKYLNQDAEEYYSTILSSIGSETFPYSGFDHTKIEPRLVGCINAFDETYSDRVKNLLFDILDSYNGNLESLLRQCNNPTFVSIIEKHFDLR